MRVLHRFFLTLLLPGLAACAAGDPAGPAASADVRFDARALQHGQWLETPLVAARGGKGEVVVEARLSAPDPCRELRASSNRSGSSLALEVVIRPAGEGACIAVIGTFEYQAVWQGLAPGTYRVRVSHAYPQTGWPSGTVFEGEVTVQ